ncbi:putative ABC transport system permease protein [Chitinophaga skermanii]|uniref:Putative ABC transport system permease protein n=1 Tax=Chitinophaga skermanii TaxID=331697 RepID=A0A327QGZ1_9BACT|nr:ABC transporter permease [Chitinophaga skermanii]RAJ03886.1 putative ABC transport system permease protein [Chitinophaga skermanii]
MFKNYVKIASRNLWKFKLYSFINIGGLAIGLAACMMMLLYVSHERNYNDFVANANNKFLLATENNFNGEIMRHRYMSYASGPMLKEKSPLVLNYARLQTPYQPVVVRANNIAGDAFTEKNIVFADPNFFQFFSYPLITGNAVAALDRPYTAVISRATAQKYFGQENPIGKVLVYDNNYKFEITGVAENAPSNTTVPFAMVLSLSSKLTMGEEGKYLSSGQQFIGGGGFSTYYELKPGTDLNKFAASIPSMNGEERRKASNDEFFFTSLNNIHLDKKLGDGNLKYLNIISLVVVLVLLLALINYMSLATARATLRAKEVGVRKAIGAGRIKIAYQFFTESGLYAVIAFMVGIAIFYVFQANFFGILGVHIDAQYLFTLRMAGLYVGLLLITIIIAGSYPAFILSAFKPVATLYGTISKSAGGSTVRKVFTVLQFSISVALIICGVIVHQQIQHFQNVHTGVDRNNVLMINFKSTIHPHYAAFNNEVQQLAGVKQTATAQYPMYEGFDMFFIRPKSDGKGNDNESTALPYFSVDSSFISLLGLQWSIAPGDYQELIHAKNTLVINEKAIEKLGLRQNPVNETINFAGATMRIGGVLKNFNYETLENAIGPMAIGITENAMNAWGERGGSMFVKIAPGTSIKPLMERLETIYKKYDAQSPFQYMFLDETFNKLFINETRLASLFDIFISITIMLACLGLFGLAAFMTEQRTKEIGIRKVLGSSVQQIIKLLSLDFIKLVFIAVIIAAPIGYFAMHQWLENFAYHVDIQWWVFVLSGLGAVTVAFITVGYQSLKAATRNPIKALKQD